LTAPVPTLCETLKTETRPLHDAAERHPFQQELVKGKLPLAGYTAYLGQMLHVHRCLEALLRCHAGHAALQAVLRPTQFREAALRADLTELGSWPPPEASPATQRLTEWMEGVAEHDAAGLLGAHYVLEGSTNGSVYIARAVRRAYALEGASGTRYLDPYGERQSETWAWFKRALEQAPLPDGHRGRIVDAARSMFAGMTAVFDDLWPGTGTRPSERAETGSITDGEGAHPGAAPARG
jgi:heme oxygenase